jgi:hypothetical protein
MTLNPQVNYPSIRAYLLKLHRDAAPAEGRIFGRLENLSSGKQFDFRSAEELLAWLAREVVPLQPDP